MSVEFDQLQLRRGTAALWVAANPLLAQGELGLETDTNLIKIGDGVTYWNSLGYSLAGVKTAAQLNSILAGTNSVSVTASQAIVAFTAYFVTTTSTAVTLTMPASANLGDWIEVYEATANANVNNITLNSSGLAINGTVQNFIMNLKGDRKFFKYQGPTYGWMVY